MNKLIQTGCEVVDEVGTWNLTGNVTPDNWYRWILRENGKPYLLAITILSEIVYWYRPAEVRDEVTGQVVGYRKRFRDDVLQKSYTQLADKYGEGKSAVKRALDVLETLDIVRREWRTIHHETMGICNNVLYLRLNSEALYRITFALPDAPDEEKPDVDNSSPADKSGDTLPANLEGGYEQICRDPVNKSDRTNTENTTEITDTDYNHPIHLRSARADPMDEMEAYKELIRQNIDYDIYMERLKYNDREQFDELYQLICDVVCMPPERIRIGGQEYPGKIVKSRFLKLRATHLEYVIECVNKTTAEINNIRAYLLTALYRSTETVINQITQQVQHDLYGIRDEEAQVA